MQQATSYTFFTKEKKKKTIIPIASLSSNLYHVSIQFKSLLLVFSLKCVALKKEEKKTGKMNVIDEGLLQKNHGNQSSIKQFLLNIK